MTKTKDKVDVETTETTTTTTITKRTDDKLKLDLSQELYLIEKTILKEKGEASKELLSDIRSHLYQVDFLIKRYNESKELSTES